MKTTRGSEAMKEFRIRHGLTQAEAASRAGFDQMLWSRYERGESTPGLESAHKIERGTEGAVRTEWFLETAPIAAAPQKRRRAVG